MTWALCLNCGEIKWGAICPCPGCQVSSTGNFDLDITFSDRRMAKETLEEFGAVVAAISGACDDQELCFWAFIRHVCKTHPNTLKVELKPDALARVETLLARLNLPSVTMRPPR